MSNDVEHLILWVFIYKLITATDWLGIYLTISILTTLLLL